MEAQTCALTVGRGQDTQAVKMSQAPHFYLQGKRKGWHKSNSVSQETGPGRLSWGSQSSQIQGNERVPSFVVGMGTHFPYVPVARLGLFT